MALTIFQIALAKQLNDHVSAACFLCMCYYLHGWHNTNCPQLD